MRLLPVAAIAALTAAARAQEGAAEVRLPLQRYDEMLRSMAALSGDGARPPAAYALGRADVDIDGRESPRMAVDVRLQIHVPKDGFTAVPVLPAGTAVDRVTVDGAPAALAALEAGACWLARGAGDYTMELSYRVDARVSADGLWLAVPLPSASAMALRATLPGEGLDVGVIPASGVRAEPSGGDTVVTATLPATSAVQLAWRTPHRLEPSIGRARYVGEARGDAVAWIATFDVDLFSDEVTVLPVLPVSATLRDLRVDGAGAPILVERGQHATLVRGAGRHVVVAEFQVPVIREGGPPRVEIDVRPVPASRFELTLPGKKEIHVDPATDVEIRSRDGATVATAHVPMTAAVSFRFTEAVPEATKAEVQANATIVHAVRASEGLLQLQAFATVEITRGEANVLSFALPAGVQVNRVASPAGVVVDWRLEDAKGTVPRRLDVFLDRQARGEIACEIHYDREIVEGSPTELPLLRALDVHRQRGMVALLPGQELPIEPAEVAGATRAGENQIPAAIREGLPHPVAHTFKYGDEVPGIKVVARRPERLQGRFDARVETLLSVGEAALRGAATVEIDVKSGALEELHLELPAGVSVLGLTGPSIREHTGIPGDPRQAVVVAFTQELQGRFRLELSYERVMAQGKVSVPLPSVRGADVAQGHVAVEALSAAEVEPGDVRELTRIDVAELPRLLLLRTTNPILLAYRYVHEKPPPELELHVTRHHLQDVREATIEQATYRTLFTRDGLAVTTADFVVKNSRKQFLRVALPAASEVWSAFVDGRPEKPATAPGEPGAILLKIVSSTRGFPVRLVYGTKGARIRRLGTVRSLLPIPEPMVIRTEWHAYLPEGVTYAEPRSNMDSMKRLPKTGLHELPRGMERDGDAEPLQIDVPASGKHFAFEKLFANQDAQASWIAIGYASSAGAFTGGLAASLAALALLVSAWAALRGLGPRRPWLLGAAAGLATLLGLGAVHPRTLGWAVAVAGGLGLLVAARRLARRRGDRRDRDVP